MELPLGTEVDVNIGEWFLKINKSLFGLNKENEKKFDLLKTGLDRRGYQKYKVDTCVFYRKYSVILTHVDYCVI